MKFSFKQLYSLALVAVLAFGIYHYIPEKQATAQVCAAGQSSGNLYGYLMTERAGPIYLSTETWNDDPLGEGHDATNQLVSVSYDRQTARFSGRGWSPYVGWIDFGAINPVNSTNRVAEIEDAKNYEDAWGRLNSEIDLSPVSYQTDPGGFVGYGINQGYTYYNDDGADELVGLGEIDFSEVSIVEPACVQYVNLTVNGANGIHQTNCPVSGRIDINWASENVTNCQVDNDNWNVSQNTTVPNVYQSGNNYYYDGPSINNSNPQEFVRIRCIGANGQSVIDSASISCGSTVTAGPGTDGIVIPNYQEV